MARTILTLPDALLARVKARAAERGISMAEYIREKLDERSDEDRPEPLTMGMANSGHTDTSRLSGEVRPRPRSWR